MSGMEVLTSFVGTAEQIVHAQRYANRFKELKELRDRVLCEPIESEGINANQRYSPIKPQSQPYIADFPVSFVKRGELPESSKERVSLQTYIDPNDETCLADFFDHDLDVGKLNILQRTLGWAAGREVSVPPLHRQLGDMGRRIIATERADLHMLWQDDILYLKPLPGYLFMESSWTVLRQNEVRWKNALGFLRTYIDLIRSEMDFDFALDTTDHARLLPKLRHPLPPGVDGPESSSFELTYKDWSEFARGFNEQSKGTLITALSGTRWEFDTLEIWRLNFISRLNFKKLGILTLAYGYYQRPNYSPTLQRNTTAWLVFIFAYFSIVLGAMQVGYEVPQLETNPHFIKASHGFAIFTMLAPIILACMFIVGPAFSFLKSELYDDFLSEPMLKLLSSVRRKGEKKPAAGEGRQVVTEGNGEEVAAAEDGEQIAAEGSKGIFARMRQRLFSRKKDINGNCKGHDDSGESGTGSRHGGSSVEMSEMQSRLAAQNDVNSSSGSRK